MPKPRPKTNQTAPAQAKAVEKIETKAVKPTVTVLNKTNQKQVINYKGESQNLSARGTIQLQGTLEEVEENLIFWVRKEILSITKN